jgi:hypothetical protein
MATNFNENSIVSSGGFKPSSKDTPLDIRTRVETEQDIYEIPNPYIGMIVYVKDTGKRFEILTLKEVDVGLTIKNVVDTYKQFTVDLEEYAKIEDVPTKVSELENDNGYATEGFVNSKIDNINTDLTNVSESIEGSWISVDSKDGYLKDIEILGNTIQDVNNLADIRSVGDKLEGQELYEIPVLCTNGLDSSDSNYKEHKLTILSPKTLKSYNGTKDRIVCKNNVWVHEENVTYDAEGNGTVLSTPIDTPLPYDQQVKLRTFANKTNIHFGCEIEPTLKAQVPKSLGASVSSHSEQIDNLSKELEKINNLEETVTSEVVSESDFITVENTSNGYFSDIKLEGKTLILNADNEVVEAGTEGATLKSVGKDVEQISVLSCNENLFNVDDVVSDSPLFYKCNEYIQFPASGEVTILKDDFEHDTVYTFTFKVSSNRSGDTIIINFRCEYTDGTIETFSIGNIKPNTVNMGTFTSTRGKTIKRLKNSFNASELITLYLDGTSIIKGEQSKPYTPHKQDKKRILYYNDETQQWEKPILREWDSIEKHSDGKYYYHKRSVEVVLNGSENWIHRTEVTDDGVHVIFSAYTSFKYNKSSYMICDKFNPKSVAGAGEAYSKGEGITYYNYSDNPQYAMYYVISKSKLSSQDVQGLKTWLQANPITVVYQLAEEKVYECTNLDLITYSDETNFMVKSGVLNPKVTLKVKKGIGNIVTMLQNKVSILENVFIQGLKQVLAGDMQSLAYMLYPEDFENIEQSTDETSLDEQSNDPTGE